MSKARVEKLKGGRVKESPSSTLQTCNPSTLGFANQQRAKPLHLPLLRQITAAALAELPGVTDWDLTFYLVGSKKMAEINKTHLHHEGPTDVITFDYSEPGTSNTEPRLHAEIFICVEVAIRQAREFRTTWQAEVVRYIVHALLHLLGHDDLSPTPRRRMKREENRLVQKLARRFRLAAIARPGSGAALRSTAPALSKLTSPPRLSA